MDIFTHSLEQKLRIAEELAQGMDHAVQSYWNAMECGRHAALSAWYFLKSFHHATPSVLTVGSALAVTYGSFLILKRAGLIGREEWVRVGQVASLHVYPVKGCAGVEVKRVELDRFGAAGDRRLMIVDERGSFVTQRQEPRMALIRCRVVPGGTLELEAPDTAPFVLRPVNAGKAKQVRVWDDQVEGIDQGDGVAAWLSAYFGRPMRMAGMGDAFDRPTDAVYTPQDAVGQTAYSDGFPLLLITEESLAELNRRLPGPPLPVNRFRPNMVLRGCPGPFAEDAWTAIRVGNVEMRVVKPCSRCKVTTTDQATGTPADGAQPEPLRTLSTFRSKRHLGTRVGDKTDVFFGQNVCHTQSGGGVAVGDAVEALVWRLF